MSSQYLSAFTSSRIALRRIREIDGCNSRRSAEGCVSRAPEVARRVAPIGSGCRRRSQTHRSPARRMLAIASSVCLPDQVMPVCPIWILRFLSSQQTGGEPAPQLKPAAHLKQSRVDSLLRSPRTSKVWILISNCRLALRYAQCALQQAHPLCILPGAFVKAAMQCRFLPEPLFYYDFTLP